MKIGWVLEIAEESIRYNNVRAMAIRVEAEGLDSIWLYDHLLYRDTNGESSGIWECCATVVFVRSGVAAPVCDIAAAAGVGMGTIYRHFLVPVCAQLLEACAQAGEISADIGANDNQLSRGMCGCCTPLG